MRTALVLLCGLVLFVAATAANEVSESGKTIAALSNV